MNSSSRPISGNATTTMYWSSDTISIAKASSASVAVLFDRRMHYTDGNTMNLPSVKRVDQRRSQSRRCRSSGSRSRSSSPTPGTSATARTWTTSSTRSPCGPGSHTPAARPGGPVRAVRRGPARHPRCGPPAADRTGRRQPHAQRRPPRRSTPLPAAPRGTWRSTSGTPPSWELTTTGHRRTCSWPRSPRAASGFSPATTPAGSAGARGRHVRCSSFSTTGHADSARSAVRTACARPATTGRPSAPAASLRCRRRVAR